MRLSPGLERARAGSGRRWRTATASLRTLPDVVILGTQRGGTTSLFDWLAIHRSVAASTTKEVHYFDRFYANGEHWYRAHFPLKGGSRLAIEATPYLLFYPLAPRRVATDLPASTRFIVLLRDPVQRAISQYWHSVRLKAEDQPPAVALSLEDERLAGQAEIVLARGESFARDTRFPSTNDAPRARPEVDAVIDDLRRHFALSNEDLFELLGRRLWER